MDRLEADKLLKKLSKLVLFRRGDKDLGKASEDTAQMNPAENKLYSLLRGIPCSTDDERMLVICRAQVKDRGEDSFLAARKEQRVFLGVFDGCGGSGGKTYASFGGHTGAWTAARAATIAAREWFLSALSDDAQEHCDLTTYVNRALQACKSSEPAGQVLLGSLRKEFPTTVAAFRKDIASDFTDFYWCGDSRCYVLDSDGLHQATRDDTAVYDAMRNLREDAPMTSVASASHPFRIHAKRLQIEKPSVIFAATDGCFGYLPSPMAFERLLLKTMACSSSIEDWKRRLDAQIGRVSGDDYTLTAWPHRFNTFKEMKEAFRERLAFIERSYPQVESEEALFDQWETYKHDYESMLVGEDSGSERG